MSGAPDMQSDQLDLDQNFDTQGLPVALRHGRQSLCRSADVTTKDPAYYAYPIRIRAAAPGPYVADI